MAASHKSAVSVLRDPFAIGSVILSTAPIIILHIDFFDARFFDFAIESKDYSGVAILAREITLYLDYFIALAVGHLSYLTRIPYMYLFNVMLVVAIAGLVIEVHAYALEHGASNCAARIAAALIPVMPMWHVLATTVHMLYISCAWLVFLGYRLAKARAPAVYMTGFVTLTAAFQMNSTFAFVVGLAIIDLVGRQLRSRRLQLEANSRQCAVIVYAIVIFFLLKTLLPPHGIYQDYNKLEWPFSFEVVAQMFATALEFLPYLIYGILPLLYFAPLFAADVSWNAASRRSLSAAINGKRFYAFSGHYKLILVSVALFSFAAFPYVAVLKHPNFHEYYDWTERHAVLTGAPLALLAATLAEGLPSLLAVGTLRHIARPLLAILTFGTLCYFLYVGYGNKATQAAYEASAIKALAAIQPPPPGTVHIQTVGDLVIPNVEIRFYESNWLFYKAFGRAAWMTRMDGRPAGEKIEVPEELLKGPNSRAYRMTYVMPDFSAGCHTEIRLITSGYRRRVIWRWFFGLGPGPDVRAQHVSTTCAFDRS